MMLPNIVIDVGGAAEPIVPRLKIRAINLLRPILAKQGQIGRPQATGKLALTKSKILI
jgi:hypothetical protein